MPPKKRSKRRGSQEAERMSTRAKSLEVDELCARDSAGSWDAAVSGGSGGSSGVSIMSDTEQGDIGLETQHESDTSDEDTQAAAATTQKGKGTGKGKAIKRSKKPLVSLQC